MGNRQKAVKVGKMANPPPNGKERSSWLNWFNAVVAMVAAGVSVLVVVVALAVGTGSKACGQRLSQLFAESIEVVLGDCTFTQ